MRRNVITVAVTLCALVMALTGCKELSRKALSSAGRSQLEVEVEKYNDELPEAVAEGLLVTEVAVSGDRVIYKCKMSEDMYDIDSMRDNLNGAKKGIMDSFRDGMDADLREFLQAIVDEDPTCTSPKYLLLWNRLKELRKTNINWGVIS